MYKSFLNKLCVSSLLLIVAASSTQAIDVTPMKLELTIPAGTTKEYTLQLSNRNPELNTISASTGVYRFMLSENTVVPDEQNLHNLISSCEQWITINQTDYTVNPGENSDLSFSISVPPNASGEYAACILVDQAASSEETVLEDNIESRSEISQEERMPLELDLVYRRAIPIYIFVEGTTSVEGSISEITIEDMLTESLVQENYRFKTNRIKFAVMLKNTGTQHIRAKGNIMIMDEQGNIVDTLTIGKTLPLFPGLSESIPVYWPVQTQAAATYTAIITLELSDDVITQAEKNFSVNEKGFLVQ